MPKPKKPPVIIRCASCGTDTEKAHACAWTGPEGRRYVCQDCAGKALGLR